MRSLIRHSLFLGSFIPLLALAGTNINLSPGWNLVGNTDSVAISVATRLSDRTKITSVWQWNKVANRWAFYAPSMDTGVLADYAQSKGYDVLTNIAPKEGFWVNAAVDALVTSDPLATPPVPGAPTTNLLASDLTDGWNLVASAANKNPSQLNTGLSGSLGTFGKAIVTAWGWDAPSSSWKFYAPTLEAQGSTVLSSYITSKGYLPFGTAPLATDGFWINVGAGSMNMITPVPALDAAKAFVATLRSNIKALDAADFSLQTELQAVANDLQNRTAPIAISNVNALNVAIKAFRFWDEVIQNPNATFVSSRYFYETNSISPQTPVASCGFYFDSNYTVLATNKNETKFVACSTYPTAMPPNSTVINATDVNGVSKPCRAAGEWCSTQWSSRVRLHPDALDASKFTVYTVTREAKLTASTMAYSYWDAAQSKTISGAASCPTGQSCSYYASTVSASNTNYGAPFPGSAATLVIQRDTSGQLNAVSLMGELSPAFSVQSAPTSVYDPIAMQWVYKANQTATVFGDKHNVALSSALTHVGGLDKLDLSGSMDLIKSGLLESRIELATGSYLTGRPDATGRNYDAQDGSQEILLKLKAGSSASSFNGDLKIGSFKLDASGTSYEPTRVSFAGGVQRNGVSFFDGTVTVEAPNSATFYANQAPSGINIQTARVGFVGNVIIPNRPALRVDLTSTNQIAGSVANLSQFSGQYVQGTSIVNVSGFSNALSKIVTLESSGGLKLVMDQSTTIYPLTMSGVLMGEFSTVDRMFTYTDNSYEQF